jgi:2'-5' RNA ligase
MVPRESAVIIVVPEAQDVIGPFRADLDLSAGRGVPPHVTVIYPFVPPDRIDHRTLETLARAVASVVEFDVAFARLGWFGDDVLWLAPEPSQPFRALTDAVRRWFPQHAPYGGAHADPIPHLTIGHDAPTEVLRAAAGAIAPRLPIRAHVASARLIQGSTEPDSWRTVADLPLGSAGHPS